MFSSCGFQALELGANVQTLTIVVVSVLTYYMCWRWSESARFRRTSKSGGTDSSSTSLPSPIPVLPRWLALIGGHTLQMETDKLQEQIEGWADDFGGDFELKVTGQRVIFVTGAEDIRRILLSRPTKFKRGWTPSQLPWVAKKVGLEPSLFFDEGTDWGRSRRILSPALNGHRNVTNMIPSIFKIAERVCAKLGNHEGEVVDFVSTFDQFTHDVIALAGFGFDADSVRATEDQPSLSFGAMSSLVDAIMKLIMDPISMLAWVIMPALVPWVQITKRSASRLNEVVVGAIDVMRRQIKEIDEGASEPKHEDGGALLRNLVSKHTINGARGLDRRKTFSDEEIVTQVKGLFLAGSETTAKTLAWAVYFLAKHPLVLERCREEALRVAPLSDGMVTTAEQASQLVFCSAVFKEVLRLRPVAPVLYLHSTEAFKMKSGMEFEAGTGFSVLLSHPCLSEESFTRAKDYVPERWIETERDGALRGGSSADGSSPSDVAHHEEDAMFFGGGPRKCPGMSMASLEAKIIIAAICARFDLALAPEQLDPPESVMTFTAGPQSLRLVVTKRTAA